MPKPVPPCAHLGPLLSVRAAMSQVATMVHAIARVHANAFANVFVPVCTRVWVVIVVVIAVVVDGNVTVVASVVDIIVALVAMCLHCLRARTDVHTQKCAHGRCKRASTYASVSRHTLACMRASTHGHTDVYTLLLLGLPRHRPSRSCACACARPCTCSLCISYICVPMYVCVHVCVLCAAGALVSGRRCFSLPD